ncbi:MAG: CocE/NonD family hydrolase [Euryarchaeota archaeon]|jgi:predicted acyl esterase|nr:CocE/NonD family hydrolase [Euryarchaeota archaeon]MBT4475876.1 CocE/NonD family hydrolase [Euryarchaeota archaeon]MBT4793799.1 CocE/NonD family hydrolase [Euryarchaeota archaeon]MBT6775531.1 CocE/NonD family hydrolase [Euryarchaeota archaeon]MBT7115655.1 CocE/NonD family hydrolase [Euryarchaeota archaeon]
MDEVLDAEIVEENLFSLIPKDPSFLWVKIESLVLKNKKLMILMSTILVTSIIISSTIWSAAGPGGFSKSDYEWWETPVNERYNMELNMTGWRSQLPVEGLYSWTGPTEYYVEVDLPISEQDVGYPGPALMHVSLWMPDVPNGTKVPVIATVHPYYDFGGEGVLGDDSNPNTIPDAGVGLWVLEEFVPHGYALAQISTFGTGKSTHCQDVKGLGEQIGIQEAVHWLGEQEWSNGNVGLMGKSYAGTTNWEAAQNPSEHLKTIVPISGSIGVQQMFYRNGSSEARAMLYDVLYEGATTDATSDDMRFCTDDAIGPLSPFTTWLGAGLGGDEWNDYWDERYHLQDVIDNYNGSVYIVWGLQDWNVDPYHAFPTHQLLKDAGINVRTISGQWGHNYPDQPSVHEGLESGYGAEAFPSVTRMDWAVELFPWFEYYLKDIGEEPESYVQVQRNDGNWHIEETWPAEDTVNIQYAIADWDGGMSGTVNSQQSMTITSQPLTEDTHISGLPTLHIDARTNTCNGGQLFVTMFDGTSGLRLGHATMDVRYRDGGYDAKPTSPMTSYRMLMEFNPMDVIIPEGHTIQLVVTETGEDYLPSPCATLGMTIFAGYQVLTLPTLDRPNDHKNWFNVPAWWEE